MSVVWFVVRVVIGGLAIGRGLQKLTTLFGGQGLTAAAKDLELVGFDAPRRDASMTAVGQLVAGVLIGTGVLVPLGAGLLAGIALNALTIRGRESGWGSPGAIIDAVTLAGAVVIGFVAPGAYALERAWGWEVGGGAVGVGALVIAAFVAMAGTQLRDTRKVAARREADEAEQEPLASPPIDPLTSETATDPAEATEGESVPNPVAKRDEERELEQARSGSGPDHGQA